MKKIKTKKGQEILVDDKDFVELSEYKWFITPNGYVYRTQHISFTDNRQIKTNVSMHRQILKVKKGEQVDHINHIKLDNRRCNLRICTQSQNNANKIKKELKGINFDKSRGKRLVRIACNGKQYNLGRYKLKEEAAHIYNQFAEQIYGDFARLNKL